MLMRKLYTERQDCERDIVEVSQDFIDLCSFMRRQTTEHCDQYTLEHFDTLLRKNVLHNFDEFNVMTSYDIQFAVYDYLDENISAD